MGPLYEELLPVYDVSDQLAVVTDADPAAAWRALEQVDLIEIGRRRPLVGLLGAIRGLPKLVTDLLHGRRPQRPASPLRIRDLTGMLGDEGGWVLLGERPGEELALGLVGKFWRPVIEFVDVDPDGFRDFARPGYAKTIYSLAVRPRAEGGALLEATMRTATTDEVARRRFRRYWVLGVGSGAHLSVHAMLERAREIAESRDAARRP